MFFIFNFLNSELEKISQWFKVNKLSINIKKTKFTLFHKNSSKDDIPVKLPALMVGSNNIERTSSKTIFGSNARRTYILDWSCKNRSK